MTSAPAPLRQLVDELLVEYQSDSDRVAMKDHVCTLFGRDRCTHEVLDGMPLLGRVAGVLVPGTTPKDATSARGRRAGSPAPWDPAAGLLLDTVWRGALDLLASVRLALGLPRWPEVADHVRYPSWRPPLRLQRVQTSLDRLPLERAGRIALGLLPTWEELLRRRHPDHALVVGELISAGHPERGHHVGDVERNVRAWHHKALLITGHVEPPRRLMQIRNTLLGVNLRGPLCAGLCEHPSCFQIWRSRQGPYMTARCPHCDGRYLTEDPELGTFYCPRRHCRDEDGARNEWSRYQLRHLGMWPGDDEIANSHNAIERGRRGRMAEQRDLIQTIIASTAGGAA